jgi:hypothetical protein
MSEMQILTILFGTLAGFVAGIMMGSPRFGYMGSLWGDLYDNGAELSVYLINFALGVAGAIIGLILSALVVIYL